MDAAGYDSLVTGFYRAASGLASWDSALEPLVRKLDLWCVQLLGVDKKRGALLFSHDAGPLSTAAVLDYVRTYHRVNPRVLPAMRMKEGDWMHDQELFDEAFVARDPFYQDYLIPHGGRHLSGRKLIDDDEHMVLVGLMRGVGREPLVGSDIEWVVRATDHMTAAVRIQLRLREVYSRATVGAELMSRLPQPMVLVDAQRVILNRNEAAGRLIEDGRVVAGRNGYLACPDPAADGRLHAALQELRLDRPGTEAPARAFTTLSGTGAEAPFAAFLLPIRPAETLGAFGHLPMALVVFHDFGARSAPDPLVVAALWGLTPAEAKVAVRVASGETIETIAREHCVAANTVRTQLKAVFAKTGVARQADLVRAISTIPAMAG